MEIYKFIEEKINDHMYEIHFRDYKMKVFFTGALFPWRVQVYLQEKLLPIEEQIKQEFKTYYAVKNSLINYMKTRLEEDFIVEYCEKNTLVCECGVDKLKLPRFSHSDWCPKYAKRN